MEAAATVVLLARLCAPAIEPTTTLAVVEVESSFNPYAIGVVGGVLERQPRTRAEALATMKALERDGWNYSVGFGQINRKNFDRLGLTAERALDRCANLHAFQQILLECFARARRGHSSSEQHALRASLSCYYSGNFSTGFEHGYVDRVVRAALAAAKRLGRKGGAAET